MLSVSILILLWKNILHAAGTYNNSDVVYFEIDKDYASISGPETAQAGNQYYVWFTGGPEGDLLNSAKIGQEYDYTPNAKEAFFKVKRAYWQKRNVGIRWFQGPRKLPYTKLKKKRKNEKANPYFDCNYRHKDFTFRRTGTNSGGFTASRCGDGGNRLAAGEILPPFCVSGAAVARVVAGLGDRNTITESIEEMDYISGAQSVNLIWAFDFIEKRKIKAGPVT